ncbi:alpha/beta-hydrolase [Daedalea quercina L-15889]|uniref:Alpha/beta-hydrolase n=1 Tax=Daedalea quercina L-15889 TaxID=1314783 RepID=A0A165NLW5_9APHY|nr:alpha/beta-hydrolase [Daedalea quercina L-15889]
MQWPSWASAARSLSSSARKQSDVDIEGGYSDSVEVEREAPDRPPQRTEPPKDTIHQLLNSPVLYDPVRKPRNPIALCHGLYGFDVRGPSAFPILQMHYWSNVLSIVRDKLGAEVIVTSVPSTGSVASRAESLDRFLREKAPGRGINLMAHSMGGLDCRHLISNIKPTEYTPVSLTTIGTPHRGSPFMDWCTDNIGIGRLRQKEQAARAERRLAEDDARSPSSPTSHDVRAPTDPPSPKSSLSLASLPSSFTTLLLSVLDSPAYANLTSTYLNTIFNPATPDQPHVKYFSVAGRIANMSVWHPLWLPKVVLDGFEEKERERLRKEGNPLWRRDEEWGSDGLVTVQSARWGEFLGVMEGCDHWDLRGARGIEVDLPSISVPRLNIELGRGKSRDEGRKKEDGDGWSIADWAKFVKAWKKEERDAAKSAGAGISEQMQREEKRTDPRGQTAEEKEHADEVIKSSTDKLSVVFDWLSSSPEVASKPGNPSRTKSRKQAERNELETKTDLERFYIALCRKLYDEGL